MPNIKIEEHTEDNIDTTPSVQHGNDNTNINTDIKQEPLQLQQLRNNINYSSYNKMGNKQLNQRGKFIYNKQRLQKSTKKGKQKKIKLNL